jgi:hypothetical protein
MTDIAGPSMAVEGPLGEERTDQFGGEGEPPVQPDESASRAPGPVMPDRPRPRTPESSSDTDSSVSTRYKSTPKEKGKKPEPFTHRDQFENFSFALGIYFIQNPQLYRKDVEKILFVLGLCTEGIPLQWAKLYTASAFRKKKEGDRNPWGSYERFEREMEEKFVDPNAERNQLATLKTLVHKPGQPADEFFQEFEILAFQAGLGKDNRRLIEYIEEKVKPNLIRRVYDSQKVPTTYERYRDAICEMDNLEKRLRATLSEKKIPTSEPSSSTTRTRDKTRSSTSKQKQKSDRPIVWRKREVTVEEPKKDDEQTCFLCKKKGHWKKDCPLAKRVMKIRSLYDDLSVDEKDLMTQDF